MELLKEQKKLLGAEVGCKVNLDKDLFDQVYKPFFVPYSNSKRCTKGNEKSSIWHRYCE